MIRRLRNSLRDRGAVFRFSTRMTGLLIDGGRICGVEIEPGGAIETEHLLLGLGHSARDTIRTLHGLGVAMEQKPFQLGARIEHPQDVVNRMQYGPEFCTHPLLPAADYRLVAKIPGGDVFSFCMCPGGEILPATERPGVICVNGASPLGRRGRFANSGFVITLEPGEFGGPGPLAGIDLQEKIEGRAAALAAAPFGAPALRLGDFVGGRISSQIPESSYPLSLTPAPFEEFLPARVLDALRRGLGDLCTRLPILRHPEAIIVGPESRSSCPVRFLRDPETLESPSAAGLYPMGEGAGHAGGIVSAAIDGMRCAEAFSAPSQGCLTHHEFGFRNSDFGFSRLLPGTRDACPTRRSSGCGAAVPAAISPRRGRQLSLLQNSHSKAGQAPPLPGTSFVGRGGTCAARPRSGARGPVVGRPSRLPTTPGGGDRK